MAAPNASLPLSSTAQLSQQPPRNLAEHSSVKFLPAQTYEQTKEGTEKDVATSSHALHPRNPTPPLVHEDNKAATKRPSRQPQHPATDRRYTKRRRTSRHKGDLVQVLELVGTRFKLSSKYAKYANKKIWQGDACRRTHLKNKHRNDFDNGDGTYTCCEMDFVNEDKVLDHIVEEHMEDVVTVGPPSELPSNAIEGPTSVSVAMPGSTASSPVQAPSVQAPPPTVTHPQGQTLALQYTGGPMYTQQMYGVASPPDYSTNSYYGNMPTSTAQPMQNPQFYPRNHSFDAYNTNGVFDQNATSHMASPVAYNTMIPSIPNPAIFSAPFGTYGNTVDPVTPNPGPDFVNNKHLHQWHGDVSYM